MSKQEELIDFIKTLTNEQAEKLFDNLDVLLHTMRMNDKEAVFIKTFMDRVFGTEVV